MEFFDRVEEMAQLRRIRELAKSTSRFTVLTGRRRVGKTELIREAYKDSPYIYFYVSKKTQVALCEEFSEVAERILGRSIPGRTSRFSQIFRFVLEESVNRPLTLVIDEFQEFQRVDDSIFSEMARDWDEFHRKAKLNLVVSGSVNRLMRKILEDREAPLYGRNTGKIHLEPFRPSVLKSILARYNPAYTPEDVLALWTFTGGVARYVELLIDAGALTRKQMVEEIVRPDSSYFDEGRIALTQEFGGESATYFTILASIAGGKTTRDQIEAMTGCAVSGFLTKLEKEYGFISKVQPLFERSATKNCKYRIEDSFFRFWFRFVFKYDYLIEVKMYRELRDIVERDYEVFSGHALESLFRQVFLEEHAYSRLGGWWDRKGENEIDLVCENEFKNELAIFEVKRDSKRFNPKLLAAKVEAFLGKNPDKRSRNLTLGVLSLADI